MDGFTQGALGAVAAQAVVGDKLGRATVPVGFVAGMLADADYAVRSAADPLLTLVFHRGPTHSLVFIPLGALIAAAPFMLAPSLRARWKLVLIAAFAAYATHGLLDACTSYGTMLLWPFSDARISFDWISVVDLFFTPVLAAGMVVAAIYRSRRPARIAAALAALYLGFGALQESRALDAQARIAAARGHEIAHGRVLPMPGAVLLWRSVYRTADGTIHADAIRVSPFGGPEYREGSSLQAFDPARLEFGVTAARPEIVRRDLRRYRWFTDGFWAEVPGRPGVIGDMRISGEVVGFRPLWGISVHPQRAVPVTRESFSHDVAVGELLRDTFAGGERYVAVP